MKIGEIVGLLVGFVVAISLIISIGVIAPLLIYTKRARTFSRDSFFWKMLELVIPNHVDLIRESIGSLAKELHISFGIKTEHEDQEKIKLPKELHGEEEEIYKEMDVIIDMSRITEHKY